MGDPRAARVLSSRCAQVDGSRPPPEKLPEFEEWTEPVPGGTLLPAAAGGTDLMIASGATADAALESVVALKAQFEGSPPPAEGEVEQSENVLRGSPPPAEGEVEQSENVLRGSPNGARQAAALPVDDEDITAID
eukprot:6452916-Prymnesium_polylepis.2